MGWVVAEVFGFAEKNITTDDADVFCEKKNGKGGEGDEKYLLYDVHKKNCAAKIIKFCLRQKRIATDCTDLHGLFNDSAFGRKEFATEAQKHRKYAACGRFGWPVDFADVAEFSFLSA